MNENTFTKLKVIVTGATGMVGEGVLIECLQNDMIEEVMVVGRKPCGITHPKLKETICKDFLLLFSLYKLIALISARVFKGFKLFLIAVSITDRSIAKDLAPEKDLN